MSESKTDAERKIEIRLLADEYIKVGKIVRWSQEAHCAFLTRLVGRKCNMTPAQKSEIFALLKIQGVGANASQFKKWLETPAPDGAGLLTASPTAESLYANLL